mmetsp:Transcript_128149/g.221365  ORF Transcript_128149/g.221365 Transcript_128149/m.221365 type:complete len:105 (+) Transcript_128149:226-540(+)
MGVQLTQFMEPLDTHRCLNVHNSLGHSWAGQQWEGKMKDCNASLGGNPLTTLGGPLGFGALAVECSVQPLQRKIRKFWIKIVSSLNRAYFCVCTRHTWFLKEMQ